MPRASLRGSAQSTVDPISASKISEPPMVGVPALLKCDSGPSGRTTWPICLDCRARMNQGYKLNVSSIAVIVARGADF